MTLGDAAVGSTVIVAKIDGDGATTIEIKGKTAKRPVFYTVL